jgi:hypothetical protein
VLVNRTDEPDRDDEDRVVSRRVDRPTEAAPGDEAAYRAADPVPDDDPDGSSDTPAGHAGGGTTERAADELDETAESEPTRSE